MNKRQMQVLLPCASVYVVTVNLVLPSLQHHHLPEITTPVSPQSASNNTNLERPPESQIYTMAGIFLALAVACSGFIALTVDKLDR